MQNQPIELTDLEISFLRHVLSGGSHIFTVKGSLTTSYVELQRGKILHINELPNLTGLKERGLIQKRGTNIGHFGNQAVYEITEIGISTANLGRVVGPNR